MEVKVKKRHWKNDGSTVETMRLSAYLAPNTACYDSGALEHAREQADAAIGRSCLLLEKLVEKGILTIAEACDIAGVWPGEIAEE